MPGSFSRRRPRGEPVAHRKFSEYTADQDEQFAFIAGYTAGGAPYGITWSEWDTFAEDDRETCDYWYRGDRYAFPAGDTSVVAPCDPTWEELDPFAEDEREIVSAGNTRERLVELGAERLANALIELAERSSEAYNMVDRMTAIPNGNENQSVSRFRAKLAGLKSWDRCIDWSGSYDFADGLEQMLADLSAGCDDPETGTELMIAFFEADQYIFEQCDDSSGCIGSVFYYSARDLFVRYASGYPDKTQLVQRLIELCRIDEYGVRITARDSAREFLPEDAFRQFTDGLAKAR